VTVGRQEAPRRRGRPPRISRERIVEAAYEIGIEGLTMAAVAQRLGTTHQALYTWVKDRDELVELVSDLFVQRLEAAPLPDSDWRGSLRAFAWNLRRILADVPGFASAGLGKFRTSPGFLALNERLLGHLVDAGFDPLSAQRIYHTFGTALLGWIAREEAYAPLRADPSPIAGALRATIDDSDEGFPLVEAASMPEFTAPADERFAFLVDTFLAGIPDPPSPDGGSPGINASPGPVPPGGR
jgi:AcrR family transcriptional regulator